ncbi:MAG: putative porin [Desulfobacterales bacterium]
MNKTGKFVFINLCISIIFCFGTVYAQDSYQTEVSAKYYSSEDDDNNEYKIYGVNGEVYFSKVDTTGHPLAEAAFLERIGSIEVIAGIEEFKADTNVKADGHLYGVGATFMNPRLPIAFQASFITSKLEFDSPSDGDATKEHYEFGFGYFITDRLIAGLKYGYSEVEQPIPGAKESNNYELSAKYVRVLADGTAFNIEGGLVLRQFDDGTEDGSNAIINVLCDYYINQKVSIGAGFEINTGDNKEDEGKTFAIDFKAFVLPRISINAGFAKFLADNDEWKDKESLQVSLSVRF